MEDLTIVYYTANKISDFFADNVRKKLLEVSNDLRIISISHKPINFGENICVGDIGASIYNIYKQILIGAYKVKTTFMACCEDDCLYSKDHFDYRPKEDIFGYNLNRWVLNPEGRYHYRERTTMGFCIAPTKFMIDTLEKRFMKYPVPPDTRKGYNGWGEPGRYEGNLKLPLVNREFFKSITPVIQINHKLNIGGVRKVVPTDVILFNLEYWGDAKTLWRNIHG